MRPLSRDFFMLSPSQEKADQISAPGSEQDILRKVLSAQAARGRARRDHGGHGRAAERLISPTRILWR